MASVFVAISAVSGLLTRRLGSGAATGAGLRIIAVGLVLIGLGAGRSAFLMAEIALAATGLGMGMATAPLMGAAVGAVATARAGTASALINVARMIGATLGVALLGAVYAQARGGPEGLRAAMILGALSLFACAALAWRSLD